MKERRRPRQVADVVREELSRLIRTEVSDPAVGFATLTDVVLSPDLRSARVFVSVFGGEGAFEKSVAALNRAAPMLRGMVGRNCGLRYAPELRFEEDHSLERGARIEEILKHLPPPPDEEDEEGGAGRKTKGTGRRGQGMTEAGFRGRRVPPLVGPALPPHRPPEPRRRLPRLGPRPGAGARGPGQGSPRRHARPLVELLPGNARRRATSRSPRRSRPTGPPRGTPRSSWSARSRSAPAFPPSSRGRP